MARFYFTYGSDERFPFRYGWTLVEAPDIHTAHAAFRLFHPDRTPESHKLNCADVYSEKAFKDTEMYLKGNYDERCHERIVLTREVFSQGGLGREPHEN